jgi:putative flippase GtrA
MQLAALYGLLAIIATVANIGSQVLLLAVYTGPFAISVSILVGTGLGLLVKYLLDKRYIFRFRARDLRHDSQLFLLYTLMGLLTTFVFWGFECSFYAMFGTAEMRYLGGLCGLVIGYFLKYRLDKRYVFVVARAP